jgi:hypothetical protein
MGGGYSVAQSNKLSELGLGLSSSQHNHGHIGSLQRQIVALMMPIYYIESVVSSVDIEIARANWQMIGKA